MKICLNTKAITDEMMALTALRCVTAAHPDGALLTRDHLPGLRVVMRMVFAELLLAMGDEVEECAIDSEDPESEVPYNEEQELRLEVKLRGSERFTSGMLLVMKRQMEHIVAAGTLAWVATRGDSEFAASLQSQREGALSALLENLNEVASTCRRNGWPE